MFSKNLKSLRKNKGLTYGALSRATHISVTTLSSYEQGKLEPNKENLQILANYFEVSTEDLLSKDLASRPSTNISIKMNKLDCFNNKDGRVYDTETDGLDLNSVTSQVPVERMQKPLDNCKWVSTLSNLVRREFGESCDYAWFHLTNITKIVFKYNNGIVQEFDVSEDAYSEEARDYTVIVFNQEEKSIVVDSPDNIVSNYDNYDGLKFKVPENSQIIVDKVDNKTLEVYINTI